MRAKKMNSQSGEQSAIAGAIGVEGRYDGVGHSLKVVRERKGLALADVSARLRIRRPYLEAIEEGRFAELPGAVYVSGFLRQYAEFLGLDPDQVLKSYQSESDGAALHRPVLNFPLPRPEERTPRLWLVVGALVIAGIAYALWYRHQETLRIGHELIEAVPSRLADLVPSPQPIAPAAPPVMLPPPVATAPSTPAPSAAVTAPVPSTVAPAPVAPPPAVAQAPAIQAPAVQAPTQPAPPAAVPPPVVSAAPPAATTVPQPQTAQQAQTPAPATPAASNNNYGAESGRIRLEAIAPAWIQVRGPNNEQVFTRLLNAGERYQVPDRAGLTLLTGNAGGVRIVVDGQTLAPLGNEGEVKRGISLDPERLKSPGNERQG